MRGQLVSRRGNSVTEDACFDRLPKHRTTAGLIIDEQVVTIGMTPCSCFPASTQMLQIFAGNQLRIKRQSPVMAKA